MRRIGFIGLGVVLLAIAAVVLFSRSAPMPQYQGHGADYWFDAIFTAGPAGSHPAPFEAVEAFQGMGKAALPFLVRNLECPDTRTAKIYTALYERCPSGFRKRIARPNYNNRQSAAEFVLMNMRLTSDAVPDLLELAKRSSGLTRQLALTVLLNRVQRDHPEYAAAFLPTLTDTNAAVRYLGVQLLIQVDNRSSNVVAEVSKLLNDPDDIVRVTSAYGVWQFSRETNTTVAVLKEELSKTNFNTYSPYFRGGPDLRRLVIDYLLSIHPRSPVVAEYFEPRLRSPDANTRRQACEELQHYATQAWFLEPEVAPLSNDDDEGVKEAARMALRKMNIFNTRFQ